MRRLSLIAALFLPFIIQGTVHAQQFDVAFGVGTLTAPSAASATGNHNPVSLTGGAYPVFSADLLVKRDFGFSGELAWRGSQNLYGGFQPYRPLFYDFGGIYAPQLGSRARGELSAGIGWESLRFYTGTTSCGAYQLHRLCQQQSLHGSFRRRPALLFSRPFLRSAGSRPLPGSQQSGVQFSPSHPIRRVPGILVHPRLLISADVKTKKGAPSFAFFAKGGRQMLRTRSWPRG